MEETVNRILRLLQSDDFSVDFLIKFITLTLPRLRNQQNVSLVFGRLLHCEPFWRSKENVPDNLLALIYGLIENQATFASELGSTRVLQLLVETFENIPNNQDRIVSRKLLLMSALYRALNSSSHFHLRYALERKVKKPLRTTIQSVRLNELESFQIIQILFKNFGSELGVNWICLSLFSHPLDWYSITWNALSLAFLDSAETAILPATVLSRLITHFSHRTLEDLLERLAHLAVHLRNVPNVMSSVSQRRSIFFIFVILLEAISLNQFAKTDFSSRDQNLCQRMLLLLSELEWGFQSVSSSWSTLDFIFAVALTRGKHMVAPNIENVSQVLHRWILKREELDISKLSGIPLSYTLLLIKHLQKLRIKQLLSSEVPNIPFTKSTMELIEKISNCCSFLCHVLKQNSGESLSNRYLLELCLYISLFANDISADSTDSSSITEQERIMIHLDCIFNFTLLPVPEYDLQDILCSKFQLYNQSTKKIFLKHLFSMIKRKIVSNLENSHLLLKASIGLLPFLGESEQRECLQQLQVVIERLQREYQDSIILLITKQLSTLSYPHASSLLPYWASLLISPAR
ncbi:peroxisomal importomer complex subunit Pex8 [Schizosaccharomyces osmophilus]|uniref:Peroxisomal importomer complex subunit Pex8 n=1 Tax=Schizosaccharomyces osmophilus TaxID=2545709 RepID=A0AAF0AZC0_9SCHI|nr:peroxisomal importomer complex subunit Pex8 [Schizosaccharomyces osmophilus]WBW75169.1 peroxisomal importomer complex subunit Pex8 [Schizosaccharomyces osmophilus]